MSSLTFVAPGVGAYNSVYTAASSVLRENIELYKGAYLSRVGKIVKPTQQAEDEGLAKELMETNPARLGSPVWAVI